MTRTPPLRIIAHLGRARLAAAEAERERLQHNQAVCDRAVVDTCSREAAALARAEAAERERDEWRAVSFKGFGQVSPAGLENAARETEAWRQAEKRAEAAEAALKTSTTLVKRAAATLEYAGKSHGHSNCKRCLRLKAGAQSLRAALAPGKGAT
jgi:hypothetical protein